MNAIIAWMSGTPEADRLMRIGDTIVARLNKRYWLTILERGYDDYEILAQEGTNYLRELRRRDRLTLDELMTALKELLYVTQKD